MYKTLIFVSGALLGIILSICVSNYMHGRKYATLREDHTLTNGSVLVKGTKLKYKTAFSEGFTQYTLYVHLQDIQCDQITLAIEDQAIIPYWIKPKGGIE